MLKLYEADSGYVLPFLVFLKEFDNSVALLDQEALVSQSLKVFDGSSVDVLEGLVKLGFQLLDEID